MSHIRPIPLLSEKKLVSLEGRATNIREDLIHMLARAGSGHSAGPLDLADIFTSFYFHILEHRPAQPMWKYRDRLLLSCGHNVPVRYVAMAHAGYFDISALKTFRQLGSPLQGHPEITHLPALENTSGPLGDGAAQSVGVAYAAKQDSAEWHTYCILSDGELEAGIVWESAMIAARHELDNLTWIVDRNFIQIDGNTEDIAALEPLHEKFSSFGFEVVEVDGHNIREFVEACQFAKTITQRPVVIIAHTTPGKGVDYMEGNYLWHGAPPGKGPENKVTRKTQEAAAVRSIRTLGGKIVSEME